MVDLLAESSLPSQGDTVSLDPALLAVHVGLDWAALLEAGHPVVPVSPNAITTWREGEVFVPTVRTCSAMSSSTWVTSAGPDTDCARSCIAGRVIAERLHRAQGGAAPLGRRQRDNLQLFALGHGSGR